jgi:hypothetical protein
MTHLISPRGAEAEWPWLLREMLTAEYLRQRALDFCYAGEVFKDRDDDDPAAAVLPEKRAVKELYHRCRSEAGGVFRIGTEAFRLLGYEWPNQGSDRGRRADLVGLNGQGGLVVFEGKLANNSYGPFAAVLEGLDYLACLTSESNFPKIRDGFARWATKQGVTVLPEFQNVAPCSTARHEVIVLAPADYYGLYSRSVRGAGWQSFASLPESSVLSIRFAVSDFISPVGAWTTG